MPSTRRSSMAEMVRNSIQNIAKPCGRLSYKSNVHLKIQSSQIKTLEVVWFWSQTFSEVFLRKIGFDIFILHPQFCSFGSTKPMVRSTSKIFSKVQYSAKKLFSTNSVKRTFLTTFTWQSSPNFFVKFDNNNNNNFFTFQKTILVECPHPLFSSCFC